MFGVVVMVEEVITAVLGAIAVLLGYFFAQKYFCREMAKSYALITGILAGVATLALDLLLAPWWLSYGVPFVVGIACFKVFWPRASKQNWFLRGLVASLLAIAFRLIVVAIMILIFAL